MLKPSDTAYLSPIDFNEVNKTANAFADHLEEKFDTVVDILLEYESFEVAEDEFHRTMDLLRSLHENKEYFAYRVNEVASFLPKNQPLYAFTCFVIIPALMAKSVHFRIPQSVRYFFGRLMDEIDVPDFFPNIVVSPEERLGFMAERTALLVNPDTKETLPRTDVAIFTGTSHHAERVRFMFDKRTLFISNGAGHNPIIVSPTADIHDAVHAVLTLCFYNQGQDCAAPNSILVHSNVYEAFMNTLREELAKVKVGHYKDRESRVGPISNPAHLPGLSELLVAHQEWIDPVFPGIINFAEAIVEPTVIAKPLVTGGNYTEFYAPVVIVQHYEDDEALGDYFETPQYARGAMYVTVFGESEYARSLIGKKLHGVTLHKEDTFIHNTHLHADGIERGTQPYGGYGPSASSFSINGKLTPLPTCPQREIYEQVVKPIVDSNAIQERQAVHASTTEVRVKNVRKLMGMKLESEKKESTTLDSKMYYDFQDKIDPNKRYVELNPADIYTLLNEVNTHVVADMNLEEQEQIRALRAYLLEHNEYVFDDLKVFIYAIAKQEGNTDKQNKAKQLRFFKNVYGLLLGKERGPRLAQFLIDADQQQLCKLLDI